MQVTPRSRRALRLQNLTFVALFLTAVGLAAWLSTRYTIETDWTASGRNTLSQASQALLAKLPGPVQITAYTRDVDLLRRPVAELVKRYRRYKPDISLDFVNPETEPQKARELGVRAGGEVLIAYRGQTERVQNLSEQTLTNALQRVARSGRRLVVFLQGHGERKPHGQANADLGEWGRQLENKGLKLGTVNLGMQRQIPEDTAVLVLADPRTDLFPGEVTALRDYVRDGGNLLWLAEPGPLHGLEPLAADLGIKFPAGTVVDPAAVRLFGAAFALGAGYAAHPITRDFDLLTLFPESAALDYTAPKGWDAQVFVRSSSESWLETGALSGSVGFDQGQDRQGPLNLALAMTRERAESGHQERQPGTSTLPSITGHEEHAGQAQQQRVVVIGDGDFLSNAYLGNGGNLDLGLDIINWLTHDDAFISIPPRTAPDLDLSLSPTATLVLAAGLLAILPLGLLGGGFAIWWRRRRA